MADFLNLDLHLNTRTRDLMAETWDPKVFLPPANYPVSDLPLSSSCLSPATCHLETNNT
jgi:hypothetical protein